MSRLADYFVVVGYDHERARSGASYGKVLQRFPEKDWDDCPFTQGIELFCQPAGWQVSSHWTPPTYFVSVLTDIDADRHYCAVLTFNEPIAKNPLKQRAITTAPLAGGDSDSVDVVIAESPPAVQPHQLLYAPKSVVLVSRLDYFEAFRNCLGLIYTVYIDNLPYQIETIIGNILGCVQVPPPGGPQVRFSIGAGDRQALQPPLHPSIPTTGTTVANLFLQMGIQNTVNLFTATLTDHKILFLSQSYSRLTDACHALTALIYPLKYSYVYIPVLPSSLLEVLNTPTPFMAGVHAMHRLEVSELLDVIIVDLDGGSVHIPECISLSQIPETLNNKMIGLLTKILKPELLTADEAFPPPVSKSSGFIMMDKEIRAVFIRFFADLFTGYRSCLTIIRIHPEPFISFHKANFLGHRAMVEEEFLTKVLDSMGFSSFVAERGPPYRVCDLFDEVFATLHEVRKEEDENPDREIVNIRELASQLYIHECPNPQVYTQKIPKPTEGVNNRIHQPPFPTLDWVLVQEIIDEGLAKSSVKSKLSQIRPHQPRIVPMGPHIATLTGRQLVSVNARRLEVLRNCVSFIFDNKISDARKIFPAVLRALKSKVARLALVQELRYHVQSNRVQLEHQQFDLIVRLLNGALQNDSTMDENGVAAAILPLACAFYRKLCTNVLQFAYTCVQEHAVWMNLQFWEATFYQDVQKGIRKLYSSAYDDPVVDNHRESRDFNNHGRDSWKSSTGHTPDSQRRSVTSASFKPMEVSALEIAAEQLRLWPTLAKDRQTEMINNEESTVYSQAIHYSNQMVYMRVPLDASKHARTHVNIDADESKSNSNITNSVAESDSFDAESGFDEREVEDVSSVVVRWVTRFVDKVCNESGVTQDHIRALHQMIPVAVAAHIETLEAVYSESKRLPPIQKPKILTPTPLPGEEVIMGGLRVYLIPDGREEGTGGNMGGPTLIPAEGAIFLTTYRVLFKGTPCDPLVCEQIVSRSFPVSTLTKEKKLGVQYLSHIDQWVQEGLQIRSSTFQLIKVAFDEEVSSEDVETFRKLLSKLRHPMSVFHTFAFTGLLLPQQTTPIHGKKEKHASLKGFAKRTLMKTARKAGIKSKSSTTSSSSSSSRKQKFLVPSPSFSRKSITSVRSGDSDSESRRSSVAYDDDLSIIDEKELSMSMATDPKSLEKLMERPAYRDYTRQGFCTSSHTGFQRRADPFRISTVNCNYSVSRSYPALIVVPQSISDESIRKFARSHRQYRFPVVTWKHPRTKAVLLRASGFHGKGVMGMLKHHSQGSGSSSGETSTSLEQEKYFSALVAATPSGNQKHAANVSDSLSSLDSLMLTAGTSDTLTALSVAPDTTPNSARKNPLSRAMTSIRSSGKAKFDSTLVASTTTGGAAVAHSSPQFLRRNSSGLFSMIGNAFRTSGGKGAQPLGRIGSYRDRKAAQTGSLQVGMSLTPKANGGVDSIDLVEGAVQGLQRAALYVLGEKAQVKGIKIEAFPKCDFIPVDFNEVRHVKASFKKLMRACAPNNPSSDVESNFYKLVEDSEWLPQIRNILQLAGAVVDLIDVQGSSVMVCLEDGWDITTQVVTVAQVLLDPFYRTIDGFKVLIEKEWLSFGHRFTHRSNQTAANQASGFAPMFLQFLDAVHQVQVQFPLSFEFNQFFLKFLAYHYVSNRFRTFMLDNEYERMEAGWLLEATTSSKLQSPIDGSATSAGLLPSSVMSSSASMKSSPLSIWDYMDKYNKKSPVFHNFMYSGPCDQDWILRPYSNISNLKIWDYYLNENLAHGPPYDFEVVAKETKQEEEHELIDGPPSMRRIVNGCYDNIDSKMPDACTFYLQEIHKLELDLDRLAQKWKLVWEKLEHPHHSSVRRHSSFNTQLVRSHGRSIHKRSTLEILVKGKMVGEAAKMFSQPHRFEKFTYSTPAYCDYCSHVLWGLVKTGMRCSDCAYNCHEKCMVHVPKNCARIRSVTESQSSNSNVAALPQETSGARQEVDSPTFDTFAAEPCEEHRTHEGYLYKRGAFRLKGWKQRWFVLDSVKHQLRYYDTNDDPHCKGFIDLQEVTSVTTTKKIEGAPKRYDENAFFEMKTVRRVYNFLAPDHLNAQVWIDNISQCIQ
ncbi:myotubularin-related protein 13-like [Tubulanus polymorphus]|uniref:myotubularin-related protein 13-like n=1 Tax=Tubulanus polymorphus TaxID=672921 RepID=UPI003DA52A49